MKLKLVGTIQGITVHGSPNYMDHQGPYMEPLYMQPLLLLLMTPVLSLLWHVKMFRQDSNSVEVVLTCHSSRNSTGEINDINNGPGVVHAGSLKYLTRTLD